MFSEQNRSTVTAASRASRGDPWSAEETTALQSQLDQLGYVVLKRFMSDEQLNTLRRAIADLHEREGDQAGAEFKQEPGCIRLANLVNKGACFEQLIASPPVLGLVAHVLGPEFKLSSLNARTALPGCAAQPLHADMGAVADDRGYWVCNTVWMLDGYTPDNGALRVIPGSHRRRQIPQHALDDPAARHPDETLVTGPAGSVVVMNAHLWHGGMGNHTRTPRTAVHAFYCRRDKPQQQYQKALLCHDVQARLTPELRRLLALDDALNDDLSRNVACRSGFLK